MILLLYSIGRSRKRKSFRHLRCLQERRTSLSLKRKATNHLPGIWRIRSQIAIYAKRNRKHPTYFKRPG